MNWHVYVLKSLKDGHRYVGMSSDVARRLIEHNSGNVRSTKPHRPFEVIYSEDSGSRLAARNREKYLKSGAGRELIKEIIPG